ncbi:hypothetical protein RFI_27851 [Reticulomyxa filosa]|uniref:Uncharacterized protein n=1 Tax=Reticulomyxa filosa TaxID=46433 RepID=X6M923_RETFI|nr:hypothetical protein RFI_27851 [Reticulomyxa filosa]|eukprot:ETO09525.1 hypothetical protein RFI_27851 [Reticulomyxa filosa]
MNVCFKNNKELQEHSDVSSDIVLAIAANKIDLANQNPSKESLLAQAKEYAKEIKASFFETSAKTSQGIQPLFETVAQNILSIKLKKTNADDNRVIVWDTSSNRKRCYTTHGIKFFFYENKSNFKEINNFSKLFKVLSTHGFYSKNIKKLFSLFDSCSISSNFPLKHLGHFTIKILIEMMNNLFSITTNLTFYYINKILSTFS